MPFLACQKVRRDRETKGVVQDWLDVLAAAISMKTSRRSSQGVTNAVIYMPTVWGGSVVQHRHDAIQTYCLKVFKRIFYATSSFFPDALRTCLSVYGITCTFLSFPSVVHVSWCRLASLGHLLLLWGQLILGAADSRTEGTQRRHITTSGEERLTTAVPRGYDVVWFGRQVPTVSKLVLTPNSRHNYSRSSCSQ